MTKVWYKNRDPEVLIFGVCPKSPLITFVQSLLEDVCRVLGSQKITFCCKEMMSMGGAIFQGMTKQEADIHPTNPTQRATKENS